MSDKHTPGPWKTFMGDKVIEVQTSDGKPVVNWQGFDNSHTPLRVHKANARLIATAPQLKAELGHLRAANARLTAENERLRGAVKNLLPMAVEEARRMRQSSSVHQQFIEDDYEVLKQARAALAGDTAGKEE